DHGVADHDTVGRGAADTGSAAAGHHPFIARDGDNDDPESNRFGEPAEEVEVGNVDGEGIDKGVVGHLIVVDREEVAANNPHHATEYSQQREHDNSCNKAGSHEVKVRVYGHGAEGIDLFGDFHCAKFGTHRCADPACHHKGGEDRAQFDHHGFGDH